VNVSPDELLREGPDKSLGDALDRAIAWRAATTASGAGLAYLIGRVTGTPARARTIALVALTETQLGQTLAVSHRNRPALAASLGSAAALVLVVQTPGLSQLFGCRPLGPVGWATALGSSALATGASIVLPRMLEKGQRTAGVARMPRAVDASGGGALVAAS
jgi:cation-transporting ATPase I